jgi:hypothetical protein
VPQEPRLALLEDCGSPSRRHGTRSSGASGRGAQVFQGGVFVVDFGGLLSLILSGRVGNLVMAAGFDLGCGTGVFARTQTRLWREQRE